MLSDLSRSLRQDIANHRTPMRHEQFTFASSVRLDVLRTAITDARVARALSTTSGPLLRVRTAADVVTRAEEREWKEEKKPYRTIRDAKDRDYGMLLNGSCAVRDSGMLWCVVLWDGEEDPETFKSSCLEFSAGDDLWLPLKDYVRLRQIEVADKEKP